MAANVEGREPVRSQIKGAVHGTDGYVCTQNTHPTHTARPPTVLKYYAGVVAPRHMELYRRNGVMWKVRQMAANSLKSARQLLYKGLESGYKMKHVQLLALPKTISIPQHMLYFTCYSLHGINCILSVIFYILYFIFLYCDCASRRSTAAQGWRA